MNGFVQCGYCGMMHQGMCSRIKAIEYYPDGTTKKVELHAVCTPLPDSRFAILDEKQRRAAWENWPKGKK